MDIISYGVANKAAKQEKDTRNNVLGVGIEGSFSHARARIDNLETALQGVVGQADKLIVNDAINIMKANAKFNVVAKTTKYKHQNMVFEDFLDSAGIDSSKSNGYTLDATNGLIKASGTGNYTIVTTVENADAIPEKAILVMEEFSPNYSDDLVPTMTGSISESVIISASSENATIYKAWEAFNDVNDGGWQTTYGNSTGWIKVDFSVSKIIQKYTITGSNNVDGNPNKRAPKDWILQGSNTGGDNDTEWTTVHTVTNQTGWTSGLKREFTFTNSVSYRYYRLKVTAHNGADPAYLNIGEIEMMEALSGTIQGTYSLSRDGGTTFEPITPETLFYFTDSISPKDTKLVLKAELPSNVQLLNYGLTWS